MADLTNKKRLEDQQIRSQLTREQLAFSLPGAWCMYTNPGMWRYYRHIEFVEDKILDVFNGKSDRLLISLPNQYGKSEYVSRGFSSWYLGRRPNDRTILASYDSEFAESWGRKSRDTLEEFGPAVFGVGVDPDHHAGKDWATINVSGNGKKFRGGMRTAGAGGGIAGKPAELILVEDPIKNVEQAMSKREMRKIQEWWKGDVHARVTPDTSIIVIMTRWGEDDLIGWLMQQEKEGGEHWDKCFLAEIAEKDDPLGRKEGEPLWPEQRPLEWCMKKKATLGEYWWQANRQCKPTRIGGNIIKINWFRRYNSLPERDDIDLVLVSVDTASSKDELADYTVIGVWYVVDNKYYLVDVIRDRLSHPELLETVYGVADVHKPNDIIVENKGSGISLIQHLEEETPFSVTGIEPKGDKEMRLINESNTIKTGRVFLPESGSQPWLFDFEAEISAFPNVNYKDQCDMLSQFLFYMRTNRSGKDILW